MDEFVQALKDLAVKCKFTLNDFLARVCDHFVNGLMDSDLRFYLATQVKNLMEVKLREVVSLAKQYDTTKSACGLPFPSSVDAVSNKNVCLCCRRLNHLQQNFYYKNATCNSCGATGHISCSPLCLNKSRHQSQLEENSDASAPVTMVDFSNCNFADLNDVIY